ncbi:SMC-Scp complex subunit ScpB [Fretibacterium fastidiosum]|uniref:Segregation and condensation protein B n=1 Tax=Fretibacterium fastidiosum TaxID=651822 RepID=A0AB94IXD8_9BACT|nr:SMC-Scp complex subunit ScpB [Fretibacterium fastidiosum]CBL28415.1 segregation and condensation protein B [Fretibacterium fastidiosum]
MSRSLPGRQPEAGEGLSVLAAQIEAVLFLASSPVSEAELRGVFEVSGAELARAIEELGEHLKSGHGLVLKAMAGGWVLGTNPHFAEVLSRFRDTAQRGRVRLSRAAVETAAIIAYNQPVTRSEVEELRGGFRSERVIETLLGHELIRIAGRKKASGSPLLYRTTPRFLEVFGLEAIADLPSLEELGELGAGPLDDDGRGGEDDVRDGGERDEA